MAAPVAWFERDSVDVGSSKEEPIAVLHLQLFQQHPTIDFGRLAVGSRKTLHLQADNSTLLTQHVAVEKVPVEDGFSLSADPSLPAAASLNWSSTVAPHSSVLLPVTWQPSTAGAVSKLITFKLDGKHRLQVKVLGKATVQFSQPKRPSKDQAVRSSTSGRLAPALADAHKPGSLSSSAAAAAAQRSSKAAAVSSSTSQRPQSARPAGAAANGRPPSAAGAAATRQQQETRFKAPPARSSLAASASLRLKSAGAATRSSAAGAEPAVGAAGSPVRSKAPEHARAGGSPLAATAARQQKQQPQPKPTSGRPVSGGSTALKPPSSERKTFRFFHTELWMNKQDRAFSGWLNHLLLPYTPEYLRAASEGDTSAALSDLRLAARVKGAMLAAYRSDPEVRQVMMRVEACIDAGKLRMKPEAVLFEDLVQRRQALDVLMSYNPFWLRLGVEVVTQKAVKQRCHSAGGGPGTPGGGPARRPPGFTEAVRSFLLAEFLSDPDMAAEMEAARGAAHYDRATYLFELGKLVLKRFLLLVLLMDRVATQLSSHHRTPLLFRLAGSVKSSKQAVTAFLHGRLVGEGNVLRHLELLGLRLSAEQSPLMEFPFAVSNLAVDLRDGLRLIKVAEVLTGEELLPQARFPSERRPMQLHNTSLALAALQAAGVPLAALPTSTGRVALQPEDIVDGDREKTLSLLWAAARTLQLGSVLRLPTLKAEVQRVLARARHSSRQQSLPGLSGGGRAAAAQLVPLAVYMNDELLAVLMEWVQAVCRVYGVAVRNFTSCFGDGVVLSLLVHYYLPSAVDLAAIHIPRQRRQEAGVQEAAQQAAAQEADADEADPLGDSSSASAGGGGDGASRGAQWSRGGWSAEFDTAGFGEDAAATEDARGIAANFRAVHAAARALGSVPEMLSSRDWAEHGPDERAVILFVAFLCSRLLECSKDDRAAHVIQRAWRQHIANSAGMARAHLARWVEAAGVVQRAVRAWLFRRRLREWLQQHVGAATALQAAWRGTQARQELQRLRSSCIVVQRCWRLVLAQREAQSEAAAVLIQASWRGCLARRRHGWMSRFLHKCLLACRELKQQRQEKLQAVVRLQALVRCSQAQRQLRGARAAAVVIQAAWRRHQQRSRYLQLWQAAIAVQAAWRGSQQQQSYGRLRAAAISLQAAHRGFHVRQTIRQSHAFATNLQSWRRGRQARVAFLALRQAAITLQAASRGHQERSRFLQVQEAALVLQSMRRGGLARRELKQQQAAAVVLQSAWRGGVVRAAARQQEAAATVIQAAWRGWRATQAYQRQRAAAVVLQSSWRGRQARTQISRHAAAVTTIAAAWRQKQARRSYLQQLHLITKLQAAVRRRQAQAAYREQQAAALVLQSCWRQRAVRQEVRQLQEAAVVIQSSWRCCVQRTELAAATAAVVGLQAAARGLQARREYSEQRAAAVLLQSSWRAQQARELLLRHKASAVLQSHWRRRQAMCWAAGTIQAAVVIQSSYRRHAAAAQHQRLRAAAVVLQAALRGAAARRALQLQREAATTLQSCWRAQQARQLLRQHKAATQLQAAARGWLVRQSVARQAAAATAIQASWRGHQAQQQHLRQRPAVVLLQAHVRGALARQQHRQQRAAAITIQAAVRCHQQRQRYQQAVAAVVAIQAVVRMHQAQQQLAAVRAAALTVQAAWRGHSTRQQFANQVAAVVALQAQLRGMLAKQAYSQQQAAAISMQAAARGWQQRKQYQCQMAAAVTIQAAARGRLVRQSVARQAAAATAIQAAWRGHQAQQQHLRQRATVVLLQAHVRGALARQQHRQQRAAAITIQAAVRSHQQRQRYQQAVAAVVAIQAAVRMHQAQQQLAAARAAALAIQAAWRGHSVRQALAQQHLAATRIQACWRMHAARQQYQQAAQRIVLLQACWRRHTAAAAYQQLRGAASVLQALVRGHQQRQQLQLRALAGAAVALQSCWRGRCARREAERRDAAARVIQRFARGMLARRQAKITRDYIRSCKELQSMLLQLHTRSRAATTIQSAWRGWRQRQLFLPVWRAHLEAKARQQAAVVLQQTWRCAQARAQLQQLRQEAAELAAKLPMIRAQRAWKTLYAAARAALWQQRLELAEQEAAVVTVQAAARGWLARRAMAKQLAGITRFQALWRGYKVRQRCGGASRDARRRLAAVNAAAAAAPHRRIGARTRAALDVLLASRQCSQVITAVAAIEFSTRYSKACCQLMVNSGGVAALLAFMRSCNRSKPHMEMLGHALACLANICRWPDLLPGVLHAPDCVMVLSERLQMFRDTEDIFMATVGILAVLVRGEADALAVARSAPSAIKLWEGIAQLLGRKMDMERKYIERLEGQKGSDVTAREATRKLVAAANQLDALEKVLMRVDEVAAAHGVPLVHMPRPDKPAPAAAGPGTAGGGGGGSGGGAADELVPRSAAAVVQPNLWQPKNTIVRGVFREVSSQTVAARAALGAALEGRAEEGGGGAGDSAAARCLGSSGGCVKGVTEGNALLAAVQKLPRSSEAGSKPLQTPRHTSQAAGHRATVR